DRQEAVGLFDVGESADAVEIDDALWRRHAKLHQRNQALAAGEELCVGAVMLKQGDRFRERLGRVVIEGGWNHGPIPPFPTPGLYAGQTNRVKWTIGVRTQSSTLDQRLAELA